MHLDSYNVTTDGSHEAYEFLSQGPEGTIKKVVLYQPMEGNVYNLAFGDWDEVKQRISDRVRSNNNDRDKVLATVASTVTDFINHHPDATILAQGSSPSRTRLYQMGITANWKEINERFEVFGYYRDSWEPFQKGKNYQILSLQAR